MDPRSSGRLASLLAVLAHGASVAWLFAAALFQGRTFFFRDILYYYYPNYVFLERSLHQGIWPLWNPTCDAGAPFLITDPVDLLLVGSLGAARALQLALPLHVLLAMCGVTALARRLGAGAWGSWAAGACFGLSGFMLSTLNLFELSHGVAWAPWVVWCYLGLIERPSPIAAAGLAAVAATQVSTLAAETILGTALLALILTPRWPDRRASKALAISALSTLLLSSCALLGSRALVAGTARSQGFGVHSALFYSLPPLALLEAFLPRFFGDVHTFSDLGFWGQSVFPGKYPYLLSVYLGPVTLLLASRARSRRLWLVAGIGLLLALGSYGPLAGALAVVMKSFRSPVKFLFLSDLALCLAAGLGVARAGREKGTLLSILPGVLLLGLACLSASAQGRAALVRLLSAPLDPRAELVMRTQWPGTLAVTGALCLGAGLALSAGMRLAPAAALLGVFDLLWVNGGINVSAPEAFYELRPEVRSLLRPVLGSGDNTRLFSFGVDPADRWSPAVARLNTDVWLYYMDRQSLVPRTTVLDGIDTAFDLDRAGWAPPGSTFEPDERRTSHFSELAARLRAASVRWVLAWEPVPEDQAIRRGEVQLAEMESPLRLYELRDPRPRVFWSEALPPRPGSQGDVRYERPDPHTILLTASSPPGLLVVSEGWNPAWRVYGPEGAVTPQQVDGRYLAFPTPGGARSYRLHYEPAWRTLALALSSLGLLLEGQLVVAGISRRSRASARAPSA